MPIAIESWIQNQLNSPLARACKGLAEYLNGSTHSIEGILTPNCTHSSQTWSGVCVGHEGIEAHFSQWLGHSIPKVFAELATDPVRSEPCVLIRVRDHSCGAPGLGEIRSYLGLRVDPAGLIEEVFATSFGPLPRDCRGSGMFPGIPPDRLHEERNRVGERISRSSEIELELTFRQQFREEALELTSGLLAIARDLQLPEPAVLFVDRTEYDRAGPAREAHPTLTVTRDGELIRHFEDWSEDEELREHLTALFVDLEDPGELEAVEDRRVGGIGPATSADYFHSAPSENEAILRRIKGDFRRQFVRKAMEEGSMDSLPDGWLAHDLSLEMRDFLGSQDPSCRGGEDLPDFKVGQVEVARLRQNSIHREVTSLRASPLGGGRIALEMVDEYGTRIELPTPEMGRPLFPEEVFQAFVDAVPSPTDGEAGFRIDSMLYSDLDRISPFIRCS